MVNYVEKVMKEARIVILQILDNAPDGASSSQMIATLLQGSATQLWLEQVD